MENKKKWKNLLFILPALLIVCGLLIFSFAFMLKTSFFKVGLTFIDAKYIGIKNFQLILRDKNFVKALINTFVFATARILIFTTIGYLLAVGLTFKFKGLKFVNAILFAPTLIPIALLALVFRNLFENKTGTINQVLRFLHLDILTVNWLGRPTSAYIAIIILGAFTIGVAIMYYSADLTTVSQDVINAAIIDGASFSKIVIYILFPLMKNTHKTIIVAMLIGGIRAFGEVFMLTNGGPGGSTEIIGTYLYNYISSGGSYIGYASALSLITMIIALILSIIQIKVLYKKEA